jgi:polysaccharide biosynthesis protein PslH|tara:strand:- start:6940 stop:8094 length:1155 start_codon:yes stop_codon:yes gene_type:complete
MNLLVVLSRVPYPLDKGDKLRAFHQLKYLSKNHSISLFCLNEGAINPDSVQELQKICTRVKIIQFSKFQLLTNLFNGFFNQKPFQVNYFYSKKAQNAFDQFVEELIPDAIFCQLIRTAEYVVKYSTIHKVLDYMDALSSAMDRRINNTGAFKKRMVKIEVKRLKAYEKRIASEFNELVIISEQDRNSFSFKEKESIHVISNGVDTNYFNPVDAKKEYDFLFVGNMSYPPNVDAAVHFVEDILPLIKSKKPNIKVMIAGTTPAPSVKALASHNVTITGFLEDIRSAYNQSKVFVAPLRLGAGLQNKLLEAMSMSIPCITSTLANNALMASEKEILVTDNKEEFANYCVELIKNNNFRNEIGANGQDYIKANFSWIINTKKLEGLF